MSQPEPTKRTVTAAPTHEPRPAPAPEPTPSRPRDATFAAGAARVAVDNQPGYDEQVRVQGLTRGPARSTDVVQFVLMARQAAGDRDRALSQASSAVDGLDAELDGWAVYDGNVAARSDDFTRSLEAAARAERQRQLIGTIIGILEVGKGLGQLANLAAAARGVPAAGDSVATLGKRIPVGLDVAKGARAGATLMAPKASQPSPTLDAIASLKANLDAVHDGVENLHGLRAVEKGEAAACALDAARAKTDDTREWIEQLRQLAPMDPAIGEIVSGNGEAVVTARALTTRLANAQALLRAMRASSPRTLAPGTGARALHDMLVRNRAARTGLTLRERRRLHVMIDADGAVAEERPDSEYRLVPGSPAGHTALEVAGLEPRQDIGALGAAALGATLGPAQVELVDVTLSATFSSIAHQTVSADEWRADASGVRTRFLRYARTVERGDDARMIGRAR